MTGTLTMIASAARLLAACGRQTDPAAVEPSPTASAAAVATADVGPATSAGQAGKSGSVEGVVTAVDAAAGTVTIQHGTIAAVGWPAMTMRFKADPAVVRKAAVGTRVRFDLTVQGNAAEVTAIRPQ